MQLITLTHYLAPSDFGLMAVMSVVIGFTRAFIDMGLSNAIMHHQNISHRQLSSLYWLNIFAGILACALLIIIAPFIAEFYNEPAMIQPLTFLSAAFVFVSLGNQYRVLCQKHLLFDKLAKVEIFSSAISLLSAVIAAHLGAGVYSLVIAILTNSLVSSLFFLKLGAPLFQYPSLCFRVAELRKFLSFGLFQMAENSINFFNKQFDVLLIGKLLGTEATGAYYIAKTLAFRVIDVISPIVTKISLPLMSRNQDDREVLTKIYLKSVKLVSLVTFPIFVTVAMLAEPIIAIFFGEEWEQSIILLQVLAIYSMLRATGNPIGSLLLAKGRADLGFYWNLGLFFIIPTTIYLGSSWDVTGVALSQLLLMIVLIFPGWLLLVKPLSAISFYDYLKSFLVPLLYVVTAAFLSYPFSVLDNYVTAIFSSLVVFACCYAYIIFNYGLVFFKSNGRYQEKGGVS